MIYVLLPGQSYAGNKAGTEVDHPVIDSWHVGIGVEHGDSIDGEKANINDA
jgi:hypothetical protein